MDDESSRRPSEADERDEQPERGGTRSDNTTEEHAVVRFVAPRVREIRRAGQRYPYRS